MSVVFTYLPSIYCNPEYKLKDLTPIVAVRSISIIGNVDEEYLR